MGGAAPKKPPRFGTAQTQVTANERREMIDAAGCGIPDDGLLLIRAIRRPWNATQNGVCTPQPTLELDRQDRASEATSSSG